MNSKVNLIISFAEMLQKIANETKDTDYTQTFDVAMKALSSEDGSTTIFDVAYALHECDADKVMPKPVLEYLKTVYQIGIDEGNPICMNNMGTLYYTNRCGMQSYKKATKYYEMAVKTGYPLPAENLGYVYYYGFDTEVDYEKAYKYFTMAALQGQIEALYKVGDMYRYGYYVDKSFAVAFTLYNKAFSTANGMDDCDCFGNILKRMGDAFSEGIGVEPSDTCALMFYQRAEQQFYTQIMDGDQFVQKDLDYVIKAQNKLRKRIAKNLPAMEWRD